MKTTVLVMFILLSGGASIASGQSFVNFESPQVHPIDVTPDGSPVLVTNTADNRLEILDRSPDGTIRNRGSVPVGLEPVSVRRGPGLGRESPE